MHLTKAATTKTQRFISHFPGKNPAHPETRSVEAARQEGDTTSRTRSAICRPRTVSLLSTSDAEVLTRPSRPKQTHREKNMPTARLYAAAPYQRVEGKKMMLEVSDGRTFNVKGSREANKICKDHGFKPWNF